MFHPCKLPCMRFACKVVIVANYENNHLDDVDNHQTGGGPPTYPPGTQSHGPDAGYGKNLK